MITNRNKLYAILFTACLVGYIWLYYSISTSKYQNQSIEVCLIKYITNIPCPSCGSTRAILSLIKGNYLETYNLNPFGFIIALIMLVAPFWIIGDILFRNNTLFYFFKRIDALLKKTKFLIPLILIVIINWIWNITKGL